MRMWMLPTFLLCRKHLLGEHNEIHKHKHVFTKNYSIQNRISSIVQILPFKMKKRHDQLVKEMIKRGYNHNSEYIEPDLIFYKEYKNYKVDINYNLNDLINRCPECKLKYENFINKSIFHKIYLKFLLTFL